MIVQVVLGGPNHALLVLLHDLLRREGVEGSQEEEEGD